MKALLLEMTLITIITLVPILISLAFYTLAERKIMASIQLRVGPNINGWLGLLQPILDGVKLVLKEPLFPARSNKVLFVSAPALALGISFAGWALIPFSCTAVASDSTLGGLTLFALSSLNTYVLILAG